MSNVVNLPLDRSGPAKMATDNRAGLADRASALRMALKFNRIMTAGDKVMAAEAVWRMLDRLSKQGIAKAQVLQAAGVAREADSTKHLGQYAFNPNHPKNGKDAGRLNGKPRAYVAILDAAARLAGTDPDDALLEVFGATSLVTFGIARIAAPEFEELAGRLRAIADAVALKHDLLAYFHQVMHANINFYVTNAEGETKRNKLSPKNIELATMGLDFPLDWPITFYQPSQDFLQHDGNGAIPPYPSVTLGKWELGEQSRFFFDRDETLTISGPEAKSTSGILHGQYSVDIRLCIIPVGSNLQFVPALRLKLGLRLYFPGLDFNESVWSARDYSVSDFLPTNEPDDCCLVFGPCQSINCRLWSENPGLPNLINHYFPIQNKKWRRSCLFVPLTGIVVQDWFSLSNLDNVTPDLNKMPLHDRALGESLLSISSGRYFSPFKGGTIAAGLDNCLSGAGGVDPLDMLNACTGQFVGLFQRASTLARLERDANMAQLDVRLRKMRGEDP